MSRRIVTPEAGAPSGSSAATTRGTRALLACGVVAGPLFVAVALLQALTRDGFDLGRDAGYRHWPQLLSDLARRLDQATSSRESSMVGGDRGRRP